MAREHTKYSCKSIEVGGKVKGSQANRRKDAINGQARARGSGAHAGNAAQARRAEGGLHSTHEFRVRQFQSTIFKKSEVRERTARGAREMITHSPGEKPRIVRDIQRGCDQKKRPLDVVTDEFIWSSLGRDTGLLA